MLSVAGAVLLSACGSPHATDLDPKGVPISPPAVPSPMPPPANEALLSRAKPLELDTPYVPPPGDPLEHNTSGYAKTMCSAVFITGLDADVAAESVGYFTGPYAERKKVSKPIIDRGKREVRITLPNGVAVVARDFGSQGCIALPRGRDDVFFTPIVVKRNLPDPKTTSWPMGDVLPTTPMPTGIDAGKLTRAIDAAFDPAESLTSAFVVTYKGRLIAERY
ncbi:MAG TPA: hypothetical protein VG222_11245, partial [Vicinamibacterales bacterium]|nr:hypothetical protein [Vicinamibacterales bacterium]